MLRARPRSSDHRFAILMFLKSGVIGNYGRIVVLTALGRFCYLDC